MLHIHHSNNLHQLTEALLQQLDSQRPSVLQSEIVLVQNPGMKRWLQQRISHRRGIAANLEFPLPSRFIWDIFMTQFDDVQSLSAFDGEVLRWQLLEVLQAHRDDAELRPLKPWLENDAQGLASFQLAEKLAGLFDQYLVYRPQMINSWERNTTSLHGDEAWQAYLWRLLRARNREPHRADLIKRLIERLQTGKATSDKLPARVFVFAISAMSPLYLNVLAALGQHIDIHLFNHNPCAHYWGDLESRKEQLRRGENPLVINELLASLGKQGRDYIDQFYQLGFACEEHTAFVEIEGDSMLQQLQRDILMLSAPLQQMPAGSDDSIQIFSCYSELRELQVLHDRLLERLQQDETLQPHDIVVMCPDINRQAPFIEAVFGQQPAHKRIPFNVSDHNSAANAPLLQAILGWIKLSSSRLSVSEVLGWLELPALQRAYGLDETALENIRYWVKSGHIHWAANREHKRQLGFADTTLNTWQHGVNRLLTAYMMNDEETVFGPYPASDVIMSNADYIALGQLQRLLDDLQSWAQNLAVAMTLQRWHHQINAMLEQLIAPDDEEEWQLKPLRDEIAAWRDQAAQASFGQKLDAAVIHHLLEQVLQQGAAHHHYLNGSINFCNLIPMRTLPFKIVCLIGMGDEMFPRNETPLQLDLISRHPQKGDRSSREDDRYMFLQSLLSAQQMFYISYVGRNKKDDSTLEPSVVITELMDSIEQKTGVRPDIEQTALQVFSEKNFKHGSFASEWQPVTQAVSLQPFSQRIPAIDMGSHIALKELIDFYKNPPKYFMRQRLNLSLDEAAEIHDDVEVFTLEPLQRYQLNRSLINDLMEKQTINQTRYLNSGELAEQQAGELQLQQQTVAVAELLEPILQHPQYSGLQRFSGELDLNHVLLGNIESYSEQGLLQLSLSAIKGKVLIEFWIKHCLLCATQQIQFSELIHRAKNKVESFAFKILSPDEAQIVLQDLIDGYLEGQQEILPFYPDTAFEYETEKEKSDEYHARQHIHQLWTADSFKVFYEAKDVYLQTSLKNAGLSDGVFPERLFELSSRFMTPLLDAVDNNE
jgi:exodeoxyribonuclease V gamma subunit